jgi:hypothetical protein
VQRRPVVARRAAILLFLLTVPVQASDKFPIDGPIGGVESPYTSRILQLLKTWPPKRLDELASRPEAIKIQCYETPGRDNYVGAAQLATVEAPIERVEAVLDDFPGYARIFDELKTLEVRERDGNRVLTFWEQRVPFPLVPNVKNEIWYLVGKDDKAKKIYRYQLKKSNNLTLDDGMIVLEPAGPGRTRYFEIDFWDVDIGGLAKLVAGGRVWKDSIRGLFQSDLALKLKAEHADWKDERVFEESKRAAEQAPVDKLIEGKKKLDLDAP